MMIKKIESIEGFTLEEKRALLSQFLRQEAGAAGMEAGIQAALKRGAHAESNPDSAETLRLHRQQFPALETKGYFNFGAHGPLPRSAQEAIRRSIEQVQHWGPFSTEANAWIQQEIDQTRESIAREIGAPAESIALTESVSFGLNVVLWGIDWQPGDHLLISDCEGPGTIAASLELQRRFGIELSFCPMMGMPEEIDAVDLVAKELRPATRLVVLSNVLWNTGQVLPLAALVKTIRDYTAAKSPIRILVDAAQSVGVLPLNMAKLGIDFCAFTGHKWLCGPEGVAALYVSPDAMEGLRPTFIGWRSIGESFNENAFEWQPGARRFEIGTMAYPLFAGLRAALEVHHQWGSTEERYQRIRDLNRYLWKRLKAISASSPVLTCLGHGPSGSGILAFKLNQKQNQRLVYFLEASGLMTRTMRVPDCVRICVHYFTLLSEIDQLVERIEAFCLGKT